MMENTERQYRRDIGSKIMIERQRLKAYSEADILNLSPNQHFDKKDDFDDSEIPF